MLRRATPDDATAIARVHVENELGGRALRSKAIDIGGETLEEIAYGWDDLPALLAKYASASA